MSRIEDPSVSFTEPSSSETGSIMRRMTLPRSRTLLTLLPLLALLSVAAACGGSGPDPAGTADIGPPAQNAATAPLLPTHVADLSTFDLHSYQQLLTQLHGTPVVVNIWAAWCAPCKAEAPLLHDASRTYGDRVQFLGVDILDSLDGARGFIADHSLEYPSVSADGTMVSSWDGQLSQKALDQGIKDALG